MTCCGHPMPRSGSQYGGTVMDLTARDRGNEPATA